MEKRSLSLAGHRTSVALEREFWDAVAAAAAEEGVSLPAFITEIDRRRGARNLASALRVTVLARLQARNRTAAEADAVAESGG
ncbi:ribbon-helix-helix domain-containing protein [Methylobrevis albus]|uniref:Ribbon-helix-helix domain-containing protein n=1 Tax=Methylobrevis albus TaxID=2793297 RepID=A0A931I0F6_9HYPH|nr:ribbon-helix-helix domain-containing protein [Methylobrevis albus]MBH0236706.1 ribbon-helix-helix domain-containing protein [Methylobrevis albus]